MDEAVLDVILSLKEEGSQAAAQMDRELQSITESASRAQRELNSVSRAADQLADDMRHINDPDKLAWATEELRVLKEQAAEAAEKVRTLARAEDDAARWDGVRLVNELIAVGAAAEHAADELGRITSPDQVSYLGSTIQLEAFAEAAGVATEHVHDLADAEKDAAAALDAVNREYADSAARMSAFAIQQGINAQAASLTTHRYRETSDVLERMDRELEAAGDASIRLGDRLIAQVPAMALVNRWAEIDTDQFEKLVDAIDDAARSETHFSAIEERAYSDSAARMSAFAMKQSITAQEADLAGHRYRETSDVLERMDRSLESAGSASTRLGDRLTAQVPAMALTNRWAEMNTDQFKKLADAIDDASRKGGFFSNMMGAIGGAVGGAIGGAAGLATPGGNKGGGDGSGGGGGGGVGGFIQNANLVLPGGQAAASLILGLTALMAIMSPFTAVFVAATVQVAAFAIGVTALASTLVIGAGAALGLAGAIGVMGLSAQGGADAAGALIKAHADVASATKLNETAVKELAAAQAAAHAHPTTANITALGLAQAYAAATAHQLTEAQAVQTESARGINGPVAKLIETYDKLTEVWGLRAIPYTNQMANALAAMAPIIGNVGNEVFDWFAVRWPAIFSLANDMIRALITAFVELGPPIGRVIDYVLAHSTQFEAFFNSILDWGVHAFTGLLDNLIKFSDWFFQRLPALAANTSTVMDAIGVSFQWLADKLGHMTDFFIEHWGQITKAAGDAAGKLADGWKASLPPDALRGALQLIGDGLKKITDDGNKMNNFFYALGQILGTALPIIAAFAGIVSNLLIDFITLLSRLGLLSPAIDAIVVLFLGWRAVLLGGWIVALFAPLVGLAANFWILATAEDAAGASAAFAYYQINGAGGLIGLIGRIGLLAGAAWTASYGLLAQAGASIAAAIGMDALATAVTLFLAATVIGLLLVALGFLLTHLTEAGEALGWLAQQFANAAKVLVGFGITMVKVMQGDTVGAVVAAGETWQAFTDGFGSNSSLIVRVANSTAAQTTSSLQGMTAKSREASQQFSGDWKTAVGSVQASSKEAYDAFIALGDNIDLGISYGILLNQAAIDRALRQAIDNAERAATHVIQARSPSLRFAETLGKPIVEGIAKGIRDGGYLVLEAVNAVVGVPSGIGAQLSSVMAQVPEGLGQQLLTNIGSSPQLGRSGATPGREPRGFGQELSTAGNIGNTDQLLNLIEQHLAAIRHDRGTSGSMLASLRLG